MGADKRKLLTNVTQSAIWLSIHGARLSSQLSALGGMSLLMCGYGFDSGFRFYQDLQDKNQKEKLLLKIYRRQQKDITCESEKDFARIQALLKMQKKSLRKSLAIQQQNLQQLEQINYARLTAQLESNIAKYHSFLWQYHAFATSGLAAGLTLDMLYLLLDYGIAPLGSHITLGFCMLNQIKGWAVDINDYMNTLAQCERKITCLLNLNFNADLQQNNQELIQNGLAPLFSVTRKGEYVMRELTAISAEKHAATCKIIMNSYWYAFMLTGMSCLFFCANPVIGLGVFGSGFISHAILKWLQPEAKTKTSPLSWAFSKVIEKTSEIYETASLPALRHSY
ncbi:MAG: hypothetical protein WC748_03295 [Legionellales bacterium]|jgi:hypothetical protein